MMRYKIKKRFGGRASWLSRPVRCRRAFIAAAAAVAAVALLLYSVDIMDGNGPRLQSATHCAI